MSIAEAVILGLLQALGEFLPISSSAHLVLLPFFRGVQYQGVSFDVMLHLATLLAVLLYFAKDWYVILKDGLTRPRSDEGKTLWLLALATVPAGVAGVLCKDWVETIFRSPLIIAVWLMLFALVLWWADRKAAADVYALARLLSSITEVKKDIEEARLKIQFVQKKIAERKHATDE